MDRNKLKPISMRHAAKAIFVRLWNGFKTAFHQQNLSDFDRDMKIISSRRSRSAVLICGTLLVLIAAFLAVIGWQREYGEAYLAANASNITQFDTYDQEWRVATELKARCGSDDQCYTYLRAKEKKLLSYELMTGAWRNIDVGIADSEVNYILVQTTIEKAAWKKFYDSDYKRLVVGMPTAWYDHALVYVNGKMMGYFLKNSRIGIPVVLEDEPAELEVEVMYKKSWHYSGLFEPHDEPLILTTPGEYKAWVRVLVMQSARQGNWLSNLSFIVMAVFFLLLYLFVDSSPEVLGLALFVGMDGFARSLNFGWLNLWYYSEISQSCDSVSQVMRLYFLMQLARIGSGRLVPWLWASLAFTVFSTTGMWLNSFGIKIIEDRSYEINVWFSLIVAAIGLLLGLFTAFKIRNKGLPWRIWALLVAAIACVLQAVAYVNYVWPEIGNYKEFFQIRSIILPVSNYLLASSAFVNISTLENRVRSLSSAKAKNDMIEKELELGRVVQNAYMKIPNLPPEIDMSCHFEAAFYVSGDAYFVHWDPETKRLAVILGDMTGHGVHAALKATTLQVIARTIFRDPMRRSGELGSRFLVYEQTLRSFLRESWGDGDLPTFLGVELDVSTGRVVSHRANFPFPMVVYETDEGRWDIKVWSDMDQVLDFKSSGRQAFVVSATDGIVGSSKQFKRLAEKLKIQINLLDEVNSEIIKAQLLRLLAESTNVVDDDKTMVVFGLKAPGSAA